MSSFRHIFVFILAMTGSDRFGNMSRQESQHSPSTVKLENKFVAIAADEAKPWKLNTANMFTLLIIYNRTASE